MIMLKREQPIENYGKKEQKEWLDNILPDPHPCTAGNKEEEHILYNVHRRLLTQNTVKIIGYNVSIN